MMVVDPKCNGHVIIIHILDRIFSITDGLKMKQVLAEGHRSDGAVILPTKVEKYFSNRFGVGPTQLGEHPGLEDVMKGGIELEDGSPDLDGELHISCADMKLLVVHAQCVVP